MERSLLEYMALAFLGGALLNVVPCVLPVLAMKVRHLEDGVDAGPVSRRMQGVTYSAGAVAAFALLAGCLLALRASGDADSRGIHFANPSFVATVTVIVFVVALNGLGVFEFSVALLDGTARPGRRRAFVAGVVAAVLSMPFGAPLLATDAGAALVYEAPLWQTSLVFVVMGLGLAAPFAVFSFAPAVGRRLPRPGPWLQTLERLMGFALMGAALWLFSVLQQQTSTRSSSYFLAFILVVGVAMWAIGRFGGPIQGVIRRYGAWAAAAVLTIVGALVFVDLEPPGAQEHSHIEWVPFDSDLVMATLATGRPVFMDYTADWCMNCKTNERLFIEVDEVRDVLERTGILPMKADKTRENEEIDRWLEPFPVAGLPVYVIYMPDQTYDLLPQTITTRILTERLLAASERFPPERFAN